MLRAPTPAVLARKHFAQILKAGLLVAGGAAMLTDAVARRAADLEAHEWQAKFDAVKRCADGVTIVRGEISRVAKLAPTVRSTRGPPTARTASSASTAFRAHGRRRRRLPAAAQRVLRHDAASHDAPLLRARQRPLQAPQQLFACQSSRAFSPWDGRKRRRRGWLRHEGVGIDAHYRGRPQDGRADEPRYLGYRQDGHFFVLARALDANIFKLSVAYEAAKDATGAAAPSGAKWSKPTLTAEQLAAYRAALF